MTRPRLLYTEADLYLQGPAFRLRDICDITGLSRDTLRAEMDRGELVGYRIVHHATSPWWFKRENVRAWWERKQAIAC